MRGAEERLRVLEILVHFGANFRSHELCFGIIRIDQQDGSRKIETVLRALLPVSFPREFCEIRQTCGWHRDYSYLARVRRRIASGESRCGPLETWDLICHRFTEKYRANQDISLGNRESPSIV